MSEKTTHRRWWLMLCGVGLSVGAPLTLWMWWHMTGSDPSPRLQVLTLGFMGSTTAVVFAIFGYLTGTLLDGLVDARQAMAAEARQDALTGLPNRRAFDLALAHELRRQQRTGGCVALIMADVDQFKNVNDEHGHPAGDAVLRDVAGHVRAVCRQVDLPARVGGEEFAVLAPGLAPDDAARVAERIREAVNKGVTTFGTKAIRVTLSAGVATSSAAAPSTASALFSSADQALYAAKQAGRNRVSTAPLS